MTRKGRIPTRPEVPTIRRRSGELLKPMKIVPVLFNGTEQAEMAEDFQRTVRARLTRRARH